MTTDDTVTIIQRRAQTGTVALLLCVGLLAGCASSGDVEQVRQEREQAKAKMSAELQQERKLAQSMEKESEARKAEADKLSKVLGGGTAGGAAAKPKMAAPLKAAGSSMSLTTALSTNGCIKSFTATPPNPQAQYTTALYIDSSTSCSNVTVGTADATFTAQTPLIPVVVGTGGTLTLNDPGSGQAMTLYASSFLIQNTGTMSAGSASTPVAGQITIVMAGNSSAAPPPTTGDQNANARDITVMDGGTLALYGGKGLSAPPDGTSNNPAKSPAFINTLYGTKSWTYLAFPAGPAKYNAQNGDAENVSAPTSVGGDMMLALANQVDWQVGDWISVATTSFSSHQTEIVQICGISTGITFDPYAAAWGMPLNLSYLTLCQKLKHYHYGGLVPTPGFFPAGAKQGVAKGGNAIDVSHQAKSFYDDHERNYGIDERAEVALLSRNIKLTSVAGQSGDANNFIGGHLVAMVSSPTAAPPTLQLVGVEIEKFGQGLVGRYPVHLHKLPQFPVTGAANAADGNIAISSSTIPANGTLVTISGVQGNTAANGQSWFVTNATGGTFELLGAKSNGTYTSGGIWTPATLLIQDVSVHHSYNKCYVVHGTGNANFYNNVCVRTVGQGMYLEDGTNITGNQFMRNLIAGTMAAQTTYSFPQQNNSQYWDGDNLQQQHTPPPTSITNATNASPICISSSSLPTIGTQITITGVGGNSAANGTWSAASDPSCPSGSSVALQSSGNGAYTTNTGMWQQQTGPKPWNKTDGGVSNATNGSPIVVTSGNTNVPQSGQGANPVTVQNVQGNTAANGTWTATHVNTTSNTFTLQSLGNGTYTSGGTWAEPPNWYNVNNVPDTSVSGLNKNPLDSTHPGGFWITNLGNTFVNNSVAGCQAKGRGYWLLSQAPTQHYGYPEFTGNRVHGCYNGIDNDDSTLNAATPSPMLSGNAQYAPVLLLTDNTITRSRNKGVWLRNWYATLHNHRLATNLRGFSLLVGGGPESTFPGFWSLVYQNVIAGMTRNNVDRYPTCRPYSPTTWQQECTDVQLLGPGAAWGNFASYNTNIQGYSYYDGPARIEHNRFVNFRFDPTGIHPNDRAARLLTVSDINVIAKTSALQQGQLEGVVTQAAANAAPSSNYQGYAGDVANGWQTSNQQTVPPTQYIRDSIWDNVDFKHQVYTEAVNMGPFNDGDKTTVIRDLDSQLSGLRVVDGSGNSHHDIVPISLNSVDYFATEYTVDEPHSRGPNDFRATSLMSPHKYATLNIESVTNPPYGIAPGSCGPSSPPNSPTCFRVEVRRDMPAYGDTVYPSLFLNGRGQLPIYEPFVMDRMGYMVYGVQGVEHYPPYTPTAFQNRLLFSYTDPAVKKVGDFFVNRIAVYQSVSMPANIKVYRIRRQWAGQQYANSSYPPGFNQPGGAGTTCDGIFSQNQGTAGTKWDDCVKRASQAGGMTILAATGATPADQWSNFEAPYKTLMGVTNPKPSDIANFINAQTFYYDTTNNLLYFYMIEEKPVQKQYSPFGTCDAANYNTGDNYLSQIQQIKTFSDPNSVQAALGASCLVSGGTPQPNDLFVCNENGCAAYLVDFSTAVVTAPTALPSTPPQPISRADYATWNQYQFVYGTPTQQPNGLPVPTTAPKDGTPLPVFLAPVDSTAPPTGDYVSYDFLPLSGGPNNGAVFQVNENFPSHCVTTPPWSPVNARGTYPPTGGFTYPLHDSPCEWLLPQAIANVTGTSSTTITSIGWDVPPAKAQVYISGVTGISNGSYTVSNPTANQFSINTTYSGSYTSGGTWQILNSIASVTTGSSLTVSVPAGSLTPPTGTQVTIAGVQGCTGSNGGPWPVATSTPSTSATGGSFSLTASGSSGTCTPNTGTWQWQPSQ